MLSGVASGYAEDRRAVETVAERTDHALVLEVGLAGDWSSGEHLHLGGTLAVEITPVENWLELESGVTVLRADGGTELAFDLLLKKPWRLSRRVELMVGVGPDVVHNTGREPGTFWGLSLIGDIMVWPRKSVGWYIEPGYELTFRHGVSHGGLGISAGLLIGR